MDRAKIVAGLKANGPRLALEAMVNVVLPLVIFDAAKPHLGDVKALMASSTPPIAWSLVEFARRRRVDALSLLVLAGIGLSLLAYLGGGSVRFLQLREKLVTAVIGLIFLGSAVIGRPLIYELARAAMRRRGADADLASFEGLKDNPYFKHTMRVMTLVWGFGLVLEAALAALLVLRLSVHDYLIAGPVLGYSTMGAITLWTFWYSRRAQRRGEERRAASASLQTSPTAPAELPGSRGESTATETPPATLTTPPGV